MSKKNKLTTVHIYLHLLLLGMFSFGKQDDFCIDYDRDFFEFSKKTGNEIGIAVLGYKRPEYFRKAIESLSKNPEAQTLPFFIFLDGGADSKQAELERIVEESGIKKYHIIKQKKNLGCGRSIINARRFMFDWCNFQRIILFEDDLVVSKNYIRFVLNLHTWATKTFSNVGVVTAFNLCFLDEESKSVQLDCVQETYGHFWGYCIDRKVYQSTKRFMDTYEKKFLMANKKKNRELVLWLRECLLKYVNLTETRRNASVLSPEINYIIRFLFHASYVAVSKHRRDGQDIEMRIALFLAGFLKISTIVNRALYIGKKGVHHTPAYWNHNKYGDMKLIEDTLKKDPNIQTFRIMPAFQSVIQ